MPSIYVEILSLSTNRRFSYVQSYTWVIIAVVKRLRRTMQQAHGPGSAAVSVGTSATHRCYNSGKAQLRPRSRLLTSCWNWTEITFAAVKRLTPRHGTPALSHAWHIKRSKPEYLCLSLLGPSLLSASLCARCSSTNVAQARSFTMQHPPTLLHLLFPCNASFTKSIFKFLEYAKYILTTLSYR